MPSKVRASSIGCQKVAKTWVSKSGRHWISLWHQSKAQAICFHHLNCCKLCGLFPEEQQLPDTRPSAGGVRYNFLCVWWSPSLSMLWQYFCQKKVTGMAMSGTPSWRHRVWPPLPYHTKQLHGTSAIQSIIRILQKYKILSDYSDISTSAFCNIWCAWLFENNQINLMKSIMTYKFRLHQRIFWIHRTWKMVFRAGSLILVHLPCGSGYAFLHIILLCKYVGLWKCMHQWLFQAFPELGSLTASLHVPGVIQTLLSGRNLPSTTYDSLHELSHNQGNLQAGRIPTVSGLSMAFQKNLPLPVHNFEKVINEKSPITQSLPWRLAASDTEMRLPWLCAKRRPILINPSSWLPIVWRQTGMSKNFACARKKLKQCWQPLL